MEAASIRPDTEFRDEDPHDRALALHRHLPAGSASGHSRAMPRRKLRHRQNRRIFETPERRQLRPLGRRRRSGVPDPLCRRHPSTAARRERRRPGRQLRDGRFDARAKNLHAVWDTTVVRRLEYSIDSGRPETTAHQLEQTYAAEQAADSWIPADDIAWESNQLARSDIYAALQIPIEPCQPTAILPQSRGTRRRSGLFLPGPAPTRSRAISSRRRDSGWRAC